MDKVLIEQNNRNVEFYVNDMVIRSHQQATLLCNTKETFQNLAQAHMKPNP